MAQKTDSRFAFKKNRLTGTQRKALVGSKEIKTNQLVDEIAQDLDLPTSIVDEVVIQFIRRLVDHVIHNEYVALTHLGVFGLKAGRQHWLLNFERYRGLRAYVNQRLDNPKNKTTIEEVNDVLQDNWYSLTTLEKHEAQLSNIRSIKRAQHVKRGN